MRINILKEISDADKNRAVDLLVTHSSPRQSYYFMVGLSIAMATMGLLLDSTAVVIGSMLIAPVLYPVLSLAMGIIISDNSLTLRSFVTLAKSLLIATIISILISVMFHWQQPEITNEIIKRVQPNLLNFAVAIVAGIAVSYAVAKPNVNEAMPGVAVSVSLVPPLAVFGIGLSRLDLGIASPALILFVVNVIGMLFSAMIVFSLMQFISKRTKVDKAVQEDNKILKDEDRNSKK